MKSRITNFLFLSLFTSFSGAATADFQSDVFDCLNIQNETDRLRCYDVTTQQHKDNLKALTTSPSVTTKTSPTAKQTASTSILPEQSSMVQLSPTQSPPSTNKLLEKKPQLISPTDSFGQPKSLGLNSIQSRIIGQFKGWKKGMKLTLENGQVWKVSSNKSGYKKITNPIITISRGAFGSFNAKVEGMNAVAKVKRIK